MLEQETSHDGIHALAPRDDMDPSARKLRDLLAVVPGAPIMQHEFGYFCIDRWRAEEGLAPDANLGEMFGLEPQGTHDLAGLGWCEAEFCPAFEEKVLESNGEYEIIQDFAGRKLQVFTGRRQGFMPTYVDHPVKDAASWEKNCLWRLDPETPDRTVALESKMDAARADAGRGKVIVQRLAGSCMYLRSLMGPEEILYALYDQPELIHSMMRTWLALADSVTARHQKYVTLDMIFFAEDICYNHGLLWSPDAVKEFAFPYYQQLIANIRARQIDQTRHLYIQVDTDGNCLPAIPLFRDGIGMDVMSPFEVASGCDVVEIGRENPWLAMSGGIDKRILCESKEAIDRMVERIIPAMRKRGGYYPTCDHSVPEETPLDLYLHYRKRCIELGG